MLQKYQQVPATSGQTNINYKKATHTTKDLQTREVLQEKKYNRKKNKNKTPLSKAKQFSTTVFFTQFGGSGEKNIYIG